MGSVGIRLYPPRVVKGQDFSDAKVFVVPRQSYTLKEILNRFVRRESLPVMKEGVYESRFGDLEKMMRLDILEKFEAVDLLKSKIADYEAYLQEKAEKEKQELAEKEKAAIEEAVKLKLAAGESTSKAPPIGA